MAANAKRLPVLKTYKLYIGGAFPRTESGRFLQVRQSDGREVNYCHASRKDFREAVVAARKAFPGWSAYSGYLRGQILYRMAEMLETRGGTMIDELTASGGVTPARARREVEVCVDRLIHYAGWADKYTQVFGSVNPVASSHFNFCTPEPTGVVGVLCPDTPSLLGFVSLVAPVIVAGNCGVVLLSELHPLPGLTFAEILQNSDLPGGVVNLLSGPREELVGPFADHMDVNAIVSGLEDGELNRRLQEGMAGNMKRFAPHRPSGKSWETAETPDWITDTIEFKTAWHPIGY